MICHNDILYNEILILDVWARKRTNLCIHCIHVFMKWNECSYNQIEEGRTKLLAMNIVDIVLKLLQQFLHNETIHRNCLGCFTLLIQEGMKNSYTSVHISSYHRYECMWSHSSTSGYFARNRHNRRVFTKHAVLYTSNRLFPRIDKG